MVVNWSKVGVSNLWPIGQIWAMQPLDPATRIGDLVAFISGGLLSAGILLVSLGKKVQVVAGS